MSAEREMLERRTEELVGVHQGRQKGNSQCRRALLYMYLKREHPMVKWEDVDFAWDELTLEYSKGELILMREQVADSPRPAEQRDGVLEKLDEEIAEAFEDPEDGGKAQLPVAD
jgi:hypothetical protein